MPNELHWTEVEPKAFAHSMAFGFIAQIEKRLEDLGLSQSELARRLAVSEGAVSKVLNNPQNLTLETIAKYTRALQTKAAIVAYDDNDRTNRNGPVLPEIFNICWERAGKPRDMWSLEAVPRRPSRAMRSRAYRKLRHATRQWRGSHEFGAHPGSQSSGIGAMGRATWSQK
jgi:transcriptional regulator with XRE-family HTH domain